TAGSGAPSPRRRRHTQALPQCNDCSRRSERAKGSSVGNGGRQSGTAKEMRNEAAHERSGRLRIARGPGNDGQMSTMLAAELAALTLLFIALMALEVVVSCLPSSPPLPEQVSSASRTSPVTGQATRFQYPWNAHFRALLTTIDAATVYYMQSPDDTAVIWAATETAVSD